jgi:hypothetical protein
MTDSDHSMSFRRVTRRLALGGLFVAAGGWALEPDALARATAATDVMPPPASGGGVARLECHI